MAVREIVKIPDPILTKKAVEAVVDEETKKLAKDLIETVDAQTNPKGAGLAAPQIGVSKRVCVVKKFTPDPGNPENELETNFILINPEILSASEAQGAGWEGCLSIPDTYGEVIRSKRVKVRSLDLNGGEFTLKAEGFFARVIQHEIDHLDGIVFLQRK
jgi:peptide deformylase